MQNHTPTNSRSHKRSSLNTATTETHHEPGRTSANAKPAWTGGIARFATQKATVAVAIEGYDRKITGQLVLVSADGDISLQHRDEHDPDTGSTMWIPAIVSPPSPPATNASSAPGREATAVDVAGMSIGIDLGTLWAAISHTSKLQTLTPRSGSETIVW